MINFFLSALGGVNGNKFNILLLCLMLSLILPFTILPSIFLGILLVTVILEEIKNLGFKKKSVSRLFFLLFLAYFLLLAISLVYSSDLALGIKVLSKKSVFFLIPITILLLPKDKISKLFICRYYLILINTVFVFLIGNALFRNFIDGYNFQYLWDRIMGVPAPENHYAYFNYWYFTYHKFTEVLKLQPMYLGLFVNLGLCTLYTQHQNRLNASFLLNALSLLTFLALLSSRTQLILGVFTFILFLLLYNKQESYKIKIGVLVMVVASVAIVSYINPIAKLRVKEALDYKMSFYSGKFGGTSLRLKKWDNAIKVIARAPIVGYGIGDYESELFKQYKADKFYLGYYKKFNAHNQYLETLLAVGFIGLLCLLALFFSGFYYARHNIFLFFTCIIFLIGFTTESMLSRQSGLFGFTFYMMLAAKFVDSEKKI